MNSPPNPLSALQRGGVKYTISFGFPLFAKQRGGSKGESKSGLQKLINVPDHQKA
jgi:hypothetical protein